jgi:hypothetical protein
VILAGHNTAGQQILDRKPERHGVALVQAVPFVTRLVAPRRACHDATGSRRRINGYGTEVVQTSYCLCRLPPGSAQPDHPLPGV